MALTPLPKISVAHREALARLDIHSLDDCLFHFPLRYEDETSVNLIKNFTDNIGTIAVKILKVSLVRKYRTELVLLCKDSSAAIEIRFFKIFRGWQTKFEEYKKSERVVYFFGEVRRREQNYEMIHPKVRVHMPDIEKSSTLMPIYPLTSGISQTFLRKLMQQAIDKCDLSDTIQPNYLISVGLPDWKTAIKQLHFPLIAHSGTTEAWDRIKFDELLAQQLWVKMLRRQKRKEEGMPLLEIGKKVKYLLNNLPFELTKAQKNAWNEISTDLKQPVPMHRLLQGDVGSGKTVIAALAICQALDNNCQAAIMAPTDILATQHFHKLSGWFSQIGIKCGLLSSSVEAKSAKAVKEALSNGEIDVIIGTHALFQESVAFHKLGLLLIDEQHRFGVDQRFKLRQKGDAPHQLLMSATPIPRTLSMTYLADLDITKIEELPPGRQPVMTKLINAKRRLELNEWVINKCKEGQQVYWVCPLIEESEKLSFLTVQQVFDSLKQSAPDLSIGIVHGRMKSAEKREIMDEFSAGKSQILVATTVIEVGVDVPHASIMVIESAQRFGLAQLHQLRGRVGRGKEKSTCILMFDEPLTTVAKERLKILYETTDGFEVAHRDLELRGAGDYYGVRQSGMPLLRFADPIRDVYWISFAAKTAEKLLDDGADVSEHLTRYHHDRIPQLKV